QAQVPFPPSFPGGPTGPYRQDVFPYPGQCTADPAHLTAGGPPPCSSRGLSIPVPPRRFGVDPATQPKFLHALANPIDYTPGPAPEGAPADYYEIGYHAAAGYQALARAGVFPDPTAFGGPPVPEGRQWTGLTCPPGGVSCTPGTPIYTPVWGFGQRNQGGGPLTTLLKKAGLFTPTAASPYVVTWPSMNIRGTRGRPVFVKWVNETPNQHLLCPYPLAWDWPCAVDRTLMGLKAVIDPATAPPTFHLSGVPYDAVNAFGSPQQPDNAVVPHLHGGEIPPGSDGFAEKWFGNRTTGLLYSPIPWFLSPAFDAPAGSVGVIRRPGGLLDPLHGAWYDTYYYPMVNDESTIWFHDHALGKTRVNVVAGPAGFFPVVDATRHYPVVGGTCTAPSGAACPAGPGECTCEYAWVDPLSARDSLGAYKYDLYLAVQDRAFNDDGSIAFPSGLGEDQSGPPPGTSPVTPLGTNPQVHPQWVPEYFADHALVNGVLWPRKAVAPGWYRLRIVDGSNARCWNLGLSTTEPTYATADAPGVAPANDVDFLVIATEQGYLPSAVPSRSLVDPTGAATNALTICPGERYELLVSFQGLVGQSVYLTNTAPAPFPDGIAPADRGSPFAHLAAVMRFDVTTGARSLDGSVIAPVTTLAIPATLDPDFVDVRDLPACGPGQDPTAARCIAAERQMYLNERLDPITGVSLGLQIDGVPFEYDVTETPRAGTWERWRVVNTTGDAHPMHPHLGRFQIVSRQPFDVLGYLSLLCGGYGGAGPGNCQAFGTGSGGVKQLVPDVSTTNPVVYGPLGFGPNALLTSPAQPYLAHEVGWKDAMIAYPGEVLTFVGRWDGRWRGAHGECALNFPGAREYGGGAYNPRKPLCFEPVTSGPYVWHCHITDHEDSEMMRSSLVLK
ncbi:MAG TPA: multicopper oxidase domain-containing protein, partial [Kineosporiaceae bacterium]|nr:multicopper oxidase domain-containing protein [Kineosporiaceae bacterium]